MEWKQQLLRYGKASLPILIIFMRFLGVGNFVVVDKRIEVPKNKFLRMLVGKRAFITLVIQSPNGRVIQEELKIPLLMYDYYIVKTADMAWENAPTYRYSLFQFANTKVRYIAKGVNRTTAVIGLTELFINAILHVLLPILLVFVLYRIVFQF